MYSTLCSQWSICDFLFLESPKKKQNEKTGEGGERNIRQMSHFINQSTNSLENLSISPKGSNTDQFQKELYGNIGIPFLEELHLKYIDKLRQNTQSFDQIITEHLKVSAVYWALCTLAMGSLWGSFWCLPLSFTSSFIRFPKTFIWSQSYRRLCCSIPSCFVIPVFSTSISLGS